MPPMASITVKKADGTTDITFTAASPSAGDSVPAVWRSNSVSTVIGHRPKLTFSFRDNAAKSGRVFQGKLVYPHTYVDVNGNYILTANTEVRFEGTLPSSVNETDKKEAIYQMGNLFVSTLMRSALSEEYAPS